ncbi:thiamine phosphate synthase [Roseibium aestuarii]|uniref:Thiamine phosphate synthase n=1 Tax=Roseibium aestuarii TaxID=2600299 RepID=A0ABW4JYG5_9HYPH|nr:thiamine phosphate synthase [Roseibium aestuarii]
MLDPFYLIVDHPRWLETLAPAGLKLAQLRVKNMAPDDLRTTLAEGLSVAGRLGITLVINDHWELARDLGAQWVHLGQEDLAETDLPALRRAGLRLGVSTHTPEELDLALAASPDYVAIGPVFPARGKVVDYPPLGEEGIRLWRARVSCPLVAIGGLRLEQAPALRRAGADSLCVITDVLQNPDPQARCAAWIRATRPDGSDGDG